NRVTKFTFDQFGHQKTHTLPMGQSESSVYDPSFGRLSTQTDFAGNQTVYGYDTLGRVHTKTLSGTFGTETITYHFDSLGRNDTVTDVTNGNTRLTSYGFDLDNRVTSVTNKVTSSGTTLSSYSYTINADGMRTGVTEQQKESDGSTSTTTKTWGYDNLMRLTSEAVTSSISANSYTDTYSYDLVGNR